jgi:predicted DNA-binding WGR domain protein
MAQTQRRSLVGGSNIGGNLARIRERRWPVPPSFPAGAVARSTTTGERLMATREFRFQDEKSDKFWRVEVEGKSQTVTFGRWGTTGQAQTKEFASDEAARQATDKLIAEKVKKGYAELSGGAASPGSAAPPVPRMKPACSRDPRLPPIPIGGPARGPVVDPRLRRKPEGRTLQS